MAMPLFSIVRNCLIKLIYYGFADKAEKDQLAPANTDGLLCPGCQHILHFKYRSYSNLGKYFCLTVVLNGQN